MRNDLRIVRTIILFVLTAIILIGCGDGSSNEGWTNEDKQLLEWRHKSEDPLRPQDYETRYFDELRHAIEAEQVVYLKYVGTKGITEREVFPTRLFRKGEHVYLEAFCLLRNDYRTFRLDRIQYLQVEPNSSMGVGAHRYS
jgi:hypothetical protein